MAVVVEAAGAAVVAVVVVVDADGVDVEAAGVAVVVDGVEVTGVAAVGAVGAVVSCSACCSCSAISAIAVSIFAISSAEAFPLLALSSSACIASICACNAAIAGSGFLVQPVTVLRISIIAITGISLLVIINLFLRRVSDGFNRTPLQRNGNNSLFYFFLIAHCSLFIVSVSHAHRAPPLPTMCRRLPSYTFRVLRQGTRTASRRGTQCH